MMPAESNDKTTVLIVDDHPVVCEGLRTILSRAPSVDVVGEAHSAREALQAVKSLGPRVVLMDARMPEMSGIEATRLLKKRSPTTKIIILTVEDSEQTLMEAIESGADGFVVKDSPPQTIISAVQSVADGDILLSVDMLRDLVHNLKETHEFSNRPALSERELEVLGLLTEGNSNRSIAEALGIAEITVKKHVQNLVRKLGARDRTHAAVMGVKHGLVE